MKEIKSSTLASFLALAVLSSISLWAETASDRSGATAKTIEDPDIPVGELVLLLRPLTKDQLLIEAEAWQAHLQESAREIAMAEIAVKRQNTEIATAKEIQKTAEETKEKLEVAKEKGTKQMTKEIEKQITKELKGIFKKR